uniref:Uncharacterized protein n=2 Tax=Melopsittacus undulatus TaxID=13146 RepID=A0A8C6JUS9_MELUD
GCAPGPADKDAASPASWRRGHRRQVPRAWRGRAGLQRGPSSLWVSSAPAVCGVLQRSAHAGTAGTVRPACRLACRDTTNSGRGSRRCPRLAQVRGHRAVPRRLARGRCPPLLPRQAGGAVLPVSPGSRSHIGSGLCPPAMAGLYRTVGIFGGFVALVAAAFYPIYFRPLLMPEEYKKEQSVNRAGVVQEDIQPAGLKVWSDPFGRK